MAEDQQEQEGQQKKQPMKEEKGPRSPERRRLLKALGILGLLGTTAVGVALGEKAATVRAKRTGELGVEWEPQTERKKIIILPAIVGMVYERPSARGDTVGFYPDAGDKPLPGEEVSLSRINPDGTKEQIAIANTNEQGVYVFGGVAPGKHRIDLLPLASPGQSFEVQGNHAGPIEITPQTTLALGTIIGKLI